MHCWTQQKGVTERVWQRGSVGNGEYLEIGVKMHEERHPSLVSGSHRMDHDQQLIWPGGGVVGLVMWMLMTPFLFLVVEDVPFLLFDTHADNLSLGVTLTSGSLSFFDFFLRVFFLRFFLRFF